MSIIERDPSVFQALDDMDWALFALAGVEPGVEVATPELHEAIEAGGEPRDLPVGAVAPEPGELVARFVYAPGPRALHRDRDREQRIADSIAPSF